MILSWVAVRDDRTGTHRMSTWYGPTREVVVTGLPPGFAGNCPTSFELPDGADVHAYPEREGVVFTMFVKAADELLAAASEMRARAR